MTLRFRVSDAPLSASLLSQLRKLTPLSLSEIRERVASGQPVVEFTPFTNSWEEDRVKLVDLAKRIGTGELPLVVSEVDESGDESPVPHDMLNNLIAHFRHIELETQRNTMLELGEIDDPDDFEPEDEDWTE